jgi:hypothetical protein
MTMNVFRHLWQAVDNLATSLNGLAGTVDAFREEIRQRCGLREDIGPPLVVEGNGQHEPTELPAARKRKPAP